MSTIFLPPVVCDPPEKRFLPRRKNLSSHFADGATPWPPSLPCPALTCVSCSVVVSSRASGIQQTGSVSRRVGLACVKNGFMYFVSKSAHQRAKNALPSARLDADAPPLLPASPTSCENTCFQTKIHPKLSGTEKTHRVEIASLNMILAWSFKVT